MLSSPDTVPSEADHLWSLHSSLLPIVKPQRLPPTFTPALLCRRLWTGCLHTCADFANHRPQPVCVRSRVYIGVSYMRAWILGWPGEAVKDQGLGF